MHHNQSRQVLRPCAPWPHLIVDGFLPPAVLAQTLGELEATRAPFAMEERRAGRIEYDVLRSPTLWRSLYSGDTIKLLSAAFGCQVSLDARNLIQLRRSNDATPAFGMHHDFVDGEDSIVCFLYLSAGWAAEHGGELLLYNTETQAQAGALVQPIQNRLVAFRTLPEHWHAVAKVRNWTRLSAMALWKVKESQAAA